MQIRIWTLWVAVYLWAGGAAFPAAGALIESTFETGDEGWAQVNLGGDYRYLDDITFDGDCFLHATGGALMACDPDAGTWMFQAPPKFLGDRSSSLDGYLEYRIRWQGEGQPDPNNPVPNVVLVSSNIGIALILGDPPINQWTTNRIQLNENAGWRWMSDQTGMEDLRPATRMQIAQVLASVTALRITGEFVNGSDTAFLDAVTLTTSEPDRPLLSIRQISAGRVELSWPATVGHHVLEARAPILTAGEWVRVNTGGSNTINLSITTTNTFFRLRRE